MIPLTRRTSTTRELVSWRMSATHTSFATKAIRTWYWSLSFWFRMASRGESTSQRLRTLRSESHGSYSVCHRPWGNCPKVVRPSLPRVECQDANVGTLALYFVWPVGTLAPYYLKSLASHEFRSQGRVPTWWELALTSHFDSYPRNGCGPNGYP